MSEVHTLDDYIEQILFESDMDYDGIYTKSELLQLVTNAVLHMPDHRCASCDVDTREIDEYFMVLPDLWRRFGMGRQMMCIGCLEWRMGRQLVRSDFTDAPINTDSDWSRSPRLRERLIA